MFWLRSLQVVYKCEVSPPEAPLLPLLHPGQLGRAQVVAPVPRLPLPHELRRVLGVTKLLPEKI